MKEVKVYPSTNSNSEQNENENAQTSEIGETVLANFDNKKDALHYPCLCQAIKYVTISCRLVGILPITSDKPERHTNSCNFRVSKPYAIYSYILQFFYIFYILVTYIFRFFCGPDSSNNGLEWYVMTFGYFITDCDSLVSLMTGSLQAKKTSKLLEKLSCLPGPIGEMRNLRRTMQRSVLGLLCSYTVVLTSYVYVGFLRLDVEFSGLYGCTLLDQPFGVVIRGLVVLVPTVEIGLIIMVALLICTKFKDLAETTRLTLENCQIVGQSSSVVNSLHNLAEKHDELFSSLEAVNKCVGLQLLMAVSSSLYTVIYYLYRYSTSSEEGTTSNTHERVHYIIGLTYRIGKLVIYMILGQNIMNSSLLPLQTLQKSKILNLPMHLQQQIQSLIMQWYGKKGNLSALNVIKLGPWLLAPIVGNVATYLLVVLQFRTSYNAARGTNNTSTIGSIF